MMEILRILIALIGTSTACYYDIFNRKNVPEKFLYFFLGISIAINIFNYSYFFSNTLSTLIAISLILFLFLLYRIGQIGGADVFVIASIYFAMPTISPIFGKESEIYFLNLPSIIPIIAFSSIVFLFFLFITKVEYCIKNIKKVKLQSVIEVAIIIFAFSFLLYSLSPIIKTEFLIFNLIILFFLCFLILFKDIISESMIKIKDIKEIEPEDVLAIEKIDEKTVKKLKLNRLITEDQLEKMKKTKIRKWPIFDLPQFLPFILIGLILYILFGDLIYFFI
jgi:Flp pilus assembly protein protease CpaA